MVHRIHHARDEKCGQEFLNFFAVSEFTGRTLKNALICNLHKCFYCRGAIFYLCLDVDFKSFSRFPPDKALGERVIQDFLMDRIPLDLSI